MNFSFLSEEPVNTGRQRELDIAKGLAVVFMVLIHVQQYFASDEVQESLLGTIIDFLGGIPAAPVFMFLLGVGVVYSRRSTPELLIRRGIILIAAGYILNICRGTLPNIFQYVADSEPYYLHLASISTVYVDIFQFAGLCLIFFGFIKKINLKDIWIFFITIGFCLLNYLLMEMNVTNPIAVIITGLFWGSSDISFFPFFSWIFYPVAGYFFGKMLIRCLDTSRFYALLLGGSILVLIVSWVIFTIVYPLDIGLSTEYSYYHHGLPANILFTSFVIAWISLLFIILKGIPAFLMTIFDRWSRNVTEMYVVQWILIGWFVPLIGYNTLDMPYFIEILVIMVLLTDIISRHFKLPI